MEKKTLNMLRTYYNNGMIHADSSRQFYSNICGYLNALYMLGLIDSTEYGCVVRHIRTGKKLSVRIFKK